METKVEESPTGPAPSARSQDEGLPVAASAVVNSVWMALMVGLTCLAVLMARQGALALWEWAVARNPYFEIKRVDIETDGILRNDQIRQWAGVRTGLNLFALDIQRVRRDLELISVIASAEVERVVPDTLRIRVAEREPVARFYYPMAPAPGAAGPQVRYYTLDGDAVFMLPLMPHQTTSPRDADLGHLPLIEGIPLQDLRPGLPAESQPVRKALDLIAAFHRSPMAGHALLASVDVARPGLFRVRTRQQTDLTFGPHDFDSQLARWRKAHDYARHAGLQLRTLDLSITNHPPATLASAEPDLAARGPETRSIEP